MRTNLKFVCAALAGVVVGACFPSATEAAGVPVATAQAVNGYEYSLVGVSRDSSLNVNQSTTLSDLDKQGGQRWHVVASIQGYNGQTTHLVVERAK